MTPGGGHPTPQPALAQELHTRLTIVHAVNERGAYNNVAGSVAHHDPLDLLVLGQQVLADARDALPADLPCEVRLLRARQAYRQAIALLAEGGHDLLIVGCECRPAPGWHVFSCDAHRLLYESPVPVVTVTDACLEPSRPGSERRDAPSRRGSREALQLARAGGR